MYVGGVFLVQVVERNRHLRRFTIKNQKLVNAEVTDDAHQL